MYDASQSNTQALHTMMMTAVMARRAEISAYVQTQSAGLVQAGPFAGMRLLADTSWGDGDMAPKLLGCYEAELHPAIEAAIARQPDLVINVGCAEGYYAVGLARRLPQAEVYAFDTSAPAQTVCQDAAMVNGVASRFFVDGTCTPAILSELCQGRQALLFMDCEGGELDLLAGRTLAALAGTEIMVECHDFLGKPITAELHERLSPSHHVENLSEGARDPNTYAMLQGIGSLDRWLAVCEFRPTRMNWLLCRPR